MFKLHNQDARELMQAVREHSKSGQFVDVTITSPPYYDLKSYGFANQIGYTQDYSTYLHDLEKIFASILNITVDTGSLWLIMDTIYKNGEILYLPFDLSKRLRRHGWKLVDIIIWKKDRTLPWHSKKGQIRNIFEYILFFAKKDYFKWYKDRIKIAEFSQLKQWWVKFPERYNPSGKFPTNIWEYSIPLQGSWGKRYLKHFNPLPPKLVERILLLTTDPGDVVLDPFAGSGVALAVADFMGRRWIGFELNPKYVASFYEHTLPEISKEMANGKNKQDEVKRIQKRFGKTIKDLRLVKYPKSLVATLHRRGSIDKEHFSVNTLFAIARKPTKTERSDMVWYRSLREDVYFVFDDMFDSKRINSSISDAISKPPLSKFGIEPKVFLYNRNDFAKEKKDNDTFEGRSLWLYSKGVTYRFKKRMSFAEWLQESEKPEWKEYFRNKVPPIVSNVKVNQHVPKASEHGQERIQVK